MLPKEAIEEFKSIYKSEFRESLSDKEATEEANIFLSLYKALINKPEPDNDIDRNSQKGGL